MLAPLAVAGRDAGGGVQGEAAGGVAQGGDALSLGRVGQAAAQALTGPGTSGYDDSVPELLAFVRSLPETKTEARRLLQA